MDDPAPFGHREMKHPKTAAAHCRCRLMRAETRAPASLRKIARYAPPTVALLLAAGCGGSPAIVDPQGPASRPIAALWWAMLWAALAVLLIVLGLLAWGLFRRRGPPSPDEFDGTAGGNRATAMVIGGGVVLPLLVLVPLFYVGIFVMSADGSREPGALEIKVIGHQYWWEVRYPGLDVTTANEIHIPAGTPVQISLTSADVIHSFWVPQLAGKADMVPGRTTELRIEADVPGEYRGQCAEFCGIQHARMAFSVIADTQSKFDEWVEQQRQPAVDPQTEAETRGRAVFMTEVCANCHQIRGTSASGTAGPDLTHLMSRQEMLAGTVSMTVQNITNWVARPNDLKSGSLMPDVELSQRDLDDVVAYLSSLE